MFKLKIKHNKYYFLLKFRLIFLNFKYLSFIKINLQEYGNNIKSLKINNLKYLNLKYNHINILLINKYINNILRNNYILIYFNDYKYIKNLKNIKIDVFCFSGYFLNINYINKINIIYDYYVDNYNVYFTLVYKFINKYIIYIFIYIYKLLTLFLNLGLKKYI